MWAAVYLCSFLLHSHTGPLFIAAFGAQPNPRLRERGGWGCIPPRAGPGKAAVVGRQTRGGEGRKEASRLQFPPGFSGSCPGQEPTPTRGKELMEKSRISPPVCVCLCMFVAGRGGGAGRGGSLVSGPPGPAPGEDATSVGFGLCPDGGYRQAGPHHGCCTHMPEGDWQRGTSTPFHEPQTMLDQMHR